MSRSEPNLQFNLPDTPSLADRIQGWGVLLTVAAVLGLTVGIGLVISALPTERTTLRAITDPHCPAPTKGQRIEIVVRNTPDGLVATCKPIFPGSIK